MARQATEKLKLEQEKAQRTLAEKDRIWAAKVESLEIELKAFKTTSAATMGQVTDKDRFYNALRTQLVEEIERLERTHKQREEEMMIENNNLQAEIESLNHFLNEAKKKECDLELSFKKQLEAALSERDASISSLKEQLAEEKVRADDYLYKLNDSKEELKSLQEQAQTCSKSKLDEMLRTQQDELEAEKRKFLTQLKRVEELSQEKLAERNDAIKGMELQLTEELKVADQKYRTAISEKRSLEAQLKTFLESSQEKEARLKSQCDSLETTLNLLLGEGLSKETHVKALVAQLTAELLELQKTFDQREQDLTEDAKKIVEERRAVQETIDKAYAEISRNVAPQEFANVYEAQKRELEFTLRELAEKSAELGELKDKEAAGLKGSRKAISATLDSFQNFMKKSKQVEDKLRGELKALVAAVKKADESHTLEEEATTAQVAALNEELKKLRIELRNRDAQNYEEKIVALETALMKVQSELEGSKKILLAHIDTINALEDRIKLKGESEAFDKDDEMVRIKMENLRLNSENAALLSGKQKMETHYADEIQKLNARYLKKAEDYDAILTKFNNLTETAANKKLEELRAWKKRSENLRKTLSTLEEKLADLSGKNTELLRFQDQHTELYTEEYKKLKEEVEKSDKYWTAKQQDWEKRAKLLEDQISVLREKSKMAELAFNQMKLLLQEKAKMIQSAVAHCEVVEKTYTSTAESLKRGTSLITDWIRKQDEISKKSGESVVEALKKQIESLQTALAATKHEHEAEVSNVSSSYLSKIALLKEKEENALLEVESLRAQLSGCRNSLAKLEKIYETAKALQKERQELLPPPAAVQTSVVAEEPVAERKSVSVLNRSQAQSKSGKSTARKEPAAGTAKKSARGTTLSAAKSVKGATGKI